MTQHYELIAIGAGPAGESAATLAAIFGHRAIVVERDKPGGTVTTTGGAPTKTLREAATYLTGFRHRDTYGISIAAPSDIMLPTIATRTRIVCATLQRVIAEEFERNHVEYLHGTARLGPGRTVQVSTPDGGAVTLSADVILIATGSRPLRPTNIPFEDPDVCDSEQIFKLDQLPSDLFIVGGGAVGVEFATIFTALGVRVTLSDMAERLLPMMDGELSRRMAEAFTQMGVQTLVGVGTQAIERVNGKLRVTLSNGATLAPDAVLFAAGRQPNTRDLGLDVAGVQCDERGFVVVDEAYRTSADGIYAAGDVVYPSLASIAMEQGRLAMFRAFGLPFREALHPVPVSAVYGMPEVAGVGLTE